MFTPLLGVNVGDASLFSREKPVGVVAKSRERNGVAAWNIFIRGLQPLERDVRLNDCKFLALHLGNIGDLYRMFSTTLFLRMRGPLGAGCKWTLLPSLQQQFF